MELVVKLSVGFSLVDGALFTAIFSLVPACVLTVVSSIFKNSRINRLIACILTAMLSIWYSAQIVYNNVFGTFRSEEHTSELQSHSEISRMPSSA